MKCFYNIPNTKTWKEDGTTGIQQMLLRPVWIENNAEYTSGIVDLHITALDYINEVRTQKSFEPEEIAFFNELNEKLPDKSYLIFENELDADDQRYYLNQVNLYVLKSFNMEQLLNWVQLYFAINGYPCTDFEETDFEAFAFDVNPIMRVFSIENVKRFENTFGYEWWKNTHKHQSDMQMVNQLLNNISNN